MNHQPKRLLDQVRDVMRVKHYSIRTEQAYVDWIRRYIMIYTHACTEQSERILNRGGLAVRSPLDAAS